MKRLAAAVLASGTLAASLVVSGTGVAGASARPHVPATTPAITVSKMSNLTTTAAVTVTGSGFTYESSGVKQSVVLAECNSDGATGTSYATQSCKLITTVAVNSAGGFTAKIYPHTGALTSSALSDCPPTATQVHVGVTCILAAANLGLQQVAFTPVFFALGTLHLKAVKQAIVNGIQLYKVVVSYTGVGKPIATGSTINGAGFAVFGVTSTNTTPGSCQSTTSSGVTWGVLPACTSVLAEKVHVVAGTANRGSFKAKTGTGVAGDFVHTFKNFKKGTYKFTLTGLLSGQTVSGSVVVP